VSADLEKLAYESALRALDKQERLVEELRARTGLVLAASSVAASVLSGKMVEGSGPHGLAIVAIVCFAASVGAAIFVLLPREDLGFSLRGMDFFESLSDSGDAAELYWRAAGDLDRMWSLNETTLRSLTHAFSVAAIALALEVATLALLLGGTLI
jgi:hypothetical protein